MTVALPPIFIVSSDIVPPSTRPRPTFYVYLLCLVACIGALLFGYDTGIVSAAMLYVPHNRGMGHLSSLWQEIIISVTPAFAAIGALLAGKSSDHWGRRRVIMCSSVVFIAGAILCGAAIDRYMLIAGRILLGVAIASMVIPVYISEGAPSYLRGTLISIYQFMIAMGFVIANLLSVAFAQWDPENIGWRLMFGAAAVPALIQLICFVFLPETPRALVKMGRSEEAAMVFGRIYGNDNRDWIEYEMAEIKTSDAIEKTSDDNDKNGLVFLRILKTGHVCRALLLGCAIQMFQQLSAVNTILYYTSAIIRSAGVRDKITTIWIACAIASIQAIVTVLPMWLIERIGRRKILLPSMAGVVLSLLAIAMSFYLINRDSARIDQSHQFDGIQDWTTLDNHSLHRCIGYSNCDYCVTNEHCGFCAPMDNASIGQCVPVNEDDSDVSSIGLCTEKGKNQYEFGATYCKTRYTAMPIAFIVIYLVCYAFGLGPMPWTLNSEIYPMWARSTAVSTATSVNWIFNVAISLTFLTLSEAITKYGAFLLYAAVSTIGLIIFYLFMPETMGCQIEEVEALFMNANERRRKAKIVADNNNQKTSEIEMTNGEEHKL